MEVGTHVGQDHLVTLGQAVADLVELVTGKTEIDLGPQRSIAVNHEDALLQRPALNERAARDTQDVLAPIGDDQHIDAHVVTQCRMIGLGQIDLKGQRAALDRGQDRGQRGIQQAVGNLDMTTLKNVRRQKKSLSLGYSNKDMIDVGIILMCLGNLLFYLM